MGDSLFRRASKFAQQWLNVVGLASLAGLFYNIDRIPHAVDRNAVIDAEGHRPLNKEFLPWAAATTAYAAVYCTILYRNCARRIQQEYHFLDPQRLTGKAGILDFASKHPFASPLVLPGSYLAVIGALAGSQGLAVSPANAVIAMVPYLTGITAGSATFSLALCILRMAHQPVAEHFIKPLALFSGMREELKQESLDYLVSRVTQLKKHSRVKSPGLDVACAVRAIEEGNAHEGGVHLEKAVNTLYAHHVTFVNMGFFGVEKILFSSLNALWASYARAKYERDPNNLTLTLLLLQSRYASKKKVLAYIEQRQNPAAYAIGALVMGAFQREDVVAPCLEVLSSTHAFERFEDYSVYSLNLPELANRRLVLKHCADKQRLRQESGNLMTFFLENRDAYVQAALPLGVYDSPRSVLLKTFANGASAYEHKDQLKTLNSVLRAIACVQKVMPSNRGVMDVDAYERKVQSSGVATEARALLERSRSYKTVFDQDAHLDNFFIADNHVGIFELETRGWVPPEQDLARCKGLCSPEQAMGFDDAVTSTYFAYAPKEIMAGRSPNSFLASVHLAVIPRALSYAMFMRNRPVMSNRIVRFIDNAEASAQRVRSQLTANEQQATERVMHTLQSIKASLA